MGEIHHLPGSGEGLPHDPELARAKARAAMAWLERACSDEWPAEQALVFALVLTQAALAHAAGDAKP